MKWGDYRRGRRGAKAAIQPRAPKQPWTASDYDILRELVAEGADWTNIADAVGQTVESCKRIARMLQIFPEVAANLGVRAVSGPAAVDERESARDRDRAYVKACLAAGGFCRIEMIGGKPVHVYPAAA
jgi:hypothetical protein